MAEENNSATPDKSDGVAVPPKRKGSNKALVIVLVVVAALLILPAIIGGGLLIWLNRGDNAAKLTESIVENTTGAEIDTEKGSVSVKNKEGDELSFGGEQNYADDFPQEVPKYPGGEVTSNIRSKTDNKIYWSNSVVTNDSVDKVNAFFSDNFSSWENKGEFTISNSTTTSYENGNLTATITVTKNNEDDKTQITYNVTEDTSADI